MARTHHFSGWRKLPIELHRFLLRRECAEMHVGLVDQDPEQRHRQRNVANGDLIRF
jgi:hypothetical protein